MRVEAVAFLRSLTPEQRRVAVCGGDAHERLDWDYVPRERAGLSLKAMDGRQRAAAHALLRAALSEAGYRQATDIMRLEEVLRAIERGRRFDRDPDNYKWILFGDPEVGTPWGWRVEGHHLSLNFTFAAGSTGAVPPAFMGAKPARVPAGRSGGFRVLGAQEDLARELIRGLPAADRDRAIIAARSLGNIVSGPGRADALRSPVGLPVGDMAPPQRALAERLIEEFVGTLGTALAEAQRARIREAGVGATSFAWAGPFEPGHAHYFRLHGPRLLIEHDNKQNDAT